MRKSRFSVEQIVFALKQVETGVPVTEECRKLGISDAHLLREDREPFSRGRH